jgi:hypothetical protein
MEELRKELPMPNYSAEERIKLFSSNCWSKDEVRRLIRDCEYFEQQLSQEETEED